jgi:Gpi18-like mannosyltransferase
VRVLISGSDIFVVGVLVTAALLAVRAEQDVLAGFLLAASTIKPQAVAILLVFVLIWAISQHKEVV